MSRYLLSLAAAASALVLAAPPASAQQFSDSYLFLKAIRDEDGPKVTEMLNDPASRVIDRRDSRTREGALHIVAKRRDPVYLSFLLQHDANPNLQDGDGNSPMMLAADRGWSEGVRILLTYSADVNLANSRGETPLIRAVQRRDAELVRLLLSAGADPDQSDVLQGKSARDYAADDSRMPTIQRMLADAPRIERARVSGPVLR